MNVIEVLLLLLLVAQIFTLPNDTIVSIQPSKGPQYSSISNDVWLTHFFMQDDFYVKMARITSSLEFFKNSPITDSLIYPHTTPSSVISTLPTKSQSDRIELTDIFSLPSSASNHVWPYSTEFPLSTLKSFSKITVESGVRLSPSFPPLSSSETKIDYSTEIEERPLTYISVDLIQESSYPTGSLSDLLPIYTRLDSTSIAITTPLLQKRSVITFRTASQSSLLLSQTLYTPNLPTAKSSTKIITQNMSSALLDASVDRFLTLHASSDIHLTSSQVSSPSTVSKKSSLASSDDIPSSSSYLTTNFNDKLSSSLVQSNTQTSVLTQVTSSHVRLDRESSSIVLQATSTLAKRANATNVSKHILIHPSTKGSVLTQVTSSHVRLDRKSSSIVLQATSTLAKRANATNVSKHILIHPSTNGFVSFSTKASLSSTQPTLLNSSSDMAHASSPLLLSYHKTLSFSTFTVSSSTSLFVVAPPSVEIRSNTPATTQPISTVQTITFRSSTRDVILNQSTSRLYHTRGAVTSTSKLPVKSTSVVMQPIISSRSFSSTSSVKYMTERTTEPTKQVLFSRLKSAGKDSMVIYLELPFPLFSLASVVIFVQEYSLRFANDEKLVTWYDVNTFERFRYCRYSAIRVGLMELNDALATNSTRRRRRRSNNLKYLFTIGSDDCSKGPNVICNGALKPGRAYRFQLEAKYLDGSTTTTPFSLAHFTKQRKVNPGTAKPLSTGILIALVVVLLFLLLLLLLVIVLVYRRRNRSTLCADSSKEIRTALMSPCPKGAGKRPDIVSERKKSIRGMTRPVSIRDFRAWVARSSSDSDYRFAEEFESMRDVGKIERHEIADMPENRSKNRYVNVLAYDYTRVKLSSVDDEPGSDYINANYIHGYKHPRAYIATQGPLPNTIDDFWRMVWEHNTRVIVMVTQLVERSRVKCQQYWPTNGSIKSGDITVSRVNEYVYPQWTEREFRLESEGVSRVIRHFQYTAWPDHGVPKSSFELLEFIQTVRTIQTAEDGPLICHCSAGVGRTGTYLCVDTLLNKLENENNVDVYGVVCVMRTQRCSMVQTEDQYILIHRVILDHLNKREEKEECFGIISNAHMKPPRNGRIKSASGEEATEALLSDGDDDFCDKEPMFTDDLYPDAICETKA